MNSDQRFVRPVVIFAGIVLAGVCVLLLVFGLAAGGVFAWKAFSAGEPSPSPATPIQATPIELAPVTATPVRNPNLTATTGLEVIATLPVTPSLALTSTFPAELQPFVTEQITPQSPEDSLAGTQTILQATDGAGPAPATGTAFPPAAQDSSCIPFNRPTRRALVVDIIDPVTIEVEDDGERYRVSYIGAALPENSQDAAVWTAATEYNRKLAAGKQVLLVQDRTEQDEVSYRPRYVLAGNVFVNLEMIASGYAIAAPRPPDLSCQNVFQEAHQQALAAQVGLYAAAPTATRILILPPTPTMAVTGPMKISQLAKRGTLWQEPEEWVEIRNESQEAIQLEGWTIQDNERHIFTFPRFTLGSGQYCRVYTNEYHPNSCGFSYESQSPIWNNDTDCAYLKDPYGVLVSTFCYGFQ